jgi:hypothetical protein
MAHIGKWNAILGLSLWASGGLGGGLILHADDPCRSGLQPGQKAGPYSFVMATGTQRGQSYCYVCETGDKPAIVVFARSMSDPLGKLTSQIDKVLTEYKTSNLRAWVTFLNDDQPSLDAKVVRWCQDHAVRSVPVGVYEDAGGPPSYRLSKEADVTVLLYVKQKVAANFAFRSGELNDERIAEVMKALPRIVEKK